MKKTKLPARLLACLMTAVFCAWGGVISCADGSNIDNSPKVTYYTVTFVNDDGSVIETQQVKSGETATEPEVEPTKEDNSTFLGWYQNDKPFLFQTKITDNIALKAKWGEPGIAYHKVIFKDDDNNSELSVKVKDGETVPAPNDPKRDGYTFVGR